MQNLSLHLAWPLLAVAAVACSPAATGPAATPSPAASATASPVATPSPAPTQPTYQTAYADGCEHLGEVASVPLSAGASRDAAVTAPVGHDRLLVTMPAAREGWFRLSPAHEGQVFIFTSEPATFSVRTVETGRAVTVVPVVSPGAATCPDMKAAARFPWSLADGKMDLQLLAPVATLSLVVFDETPEAEEE
ncbi:MAG: hypothetical protein VKO64_12400 [Candidatus Sericytochromatia bacterium]|nr:hypothetical protein [Candidatus Sericytochromatia bacterium]